VDSGYLAGMLMLDSKALLDRLDGHRRKELAPPRTHEFMEPEARLNYLKSTANFDTYRAGQLPKAEKSRVRQKAERAWAAETRAATLGPGAAGGALRGTGTLYGLAASVRWAELDEAEVAARVEASESRRREMMKRMGPARMDREREVLSRMNQKLQFLRNPRHVRGAQRGLLDPRVQEAGGVEGLRATLRAASQIGRGAGGEGAGSAAQRTQLAVQAAAQCGQSLRHPLSATSEAGVVAEPEELEFREYRPGGVFEAELLLRNVSGVLRRVRVLPPQTQYFTVEAVEYPRGGEHRGGEIAPGLHCAVLVRFAPDSLADYDDSLEVSTDVGPLTVPLRGRRHPPSLTLVREINCGAAAVGRWRAMRLRVANRGGAGAFRLLGPGAGGSRPASARQSTLGGRAAPGEPAPVPDLLQGLDCLRVGEFLVWPTQLALGAGEETDLFFAFRPARPGKATAQFKMACDNCNVRAFKLRGAGTEVGASVLRVDGRPVADGELVEMSSADLPALLRHAAREAGGGEGEGGAAPGAGAGADGPGLPSPGRDLWFGGVTPGHAVSRTVAVHNPSLLPVPFSWQLLPLPLESSADGGLGAGGRGRRPGELSAAGAFRIEPASVTLPPRAVSEFTVSFAPPAVDEFRQLVCLLLDPSTRGTCGAEATLERQVAAARGQGGAGADGDGSTDGGSEDTVGEAEVAWAPALAMGLQGVGAPADVEVSPGQLRVPADLTAGQPWELSLSLTNASAAPAAWRAAPSPGGALSLDSGAGVIPPGGGASLRLRVVAPDAPGAHEAFVDVEVEHGPSRRVPVHLRVVPPRVLVSEPGLDFGLTQLHTESVRTLTLRNLSPHTPAAWGLAVPGEEVCDLASEVALERGVGEAEAREELTAEVSQYSIASGPAARARGGAPGAPREYAVTSTRLGGMELRPELAGGLLAPGEVLRVPVRCVPRAEGALTAAMEVLLEGGSVPVPLSCDSLEVKLRLNTSRLLLGDLYVGVAASTEVLVSNVTPFPTSFQFAAAPLGEASCARVDVDSRRRYIRAGEILRVRVDLLPLAPGAVGCYLLCHVEGAARPLACRLEATVHGLQIAYRVERVPARRELQPGEGARRVTAALAAAHGADQLGLTGHKTYGNAVNAIGLTSTARGSLAAELLLAEMKRAAAHGHTFDPRATRAALAGMRDEGSELLAGDDFDPARDTLEMGRSCPLGEEQRFRLVVTNLSAIPTRVSCWVDDFRAPDAPEPERLPTALLDWASPSSASLVPGGRGQTRGRSWRDQSLAGGAESPPGSPGLLSETGVRPATGQSLAPSLARTRRSGRTAGRPPQRQKFALEDPGAPGAGAFTSHLGRTVAARKGGDRRGGEALRPGKGLSFAFDRHLSELPPMGQVAVEFSAHCNMPGVYMDCLRVQCQGAGERAFPLQVGFVGSALRVHKNRRLAAGYPHDRSGTELRLDMGEVPRHAAVTKRFHVTNVSPLPVRVTWDARAVVPDELLGLGAGGGGGASRLADMFPGRKVRKEPEDTVVVSRSPRGSVDGAPRAVAAGDAEPATFRERVASLEGGEGRRLSGSGSPERAGVVDFDREDPEDDRPARGPSPDGEAEGWAAWRARREADLGAAERLVRLDLGPNARGGVGVTIDPVAWEVPDEGVLEVTPRDGVIPGGATVAFDVTCAATPALASGRVILYGEQRLVVTPEMEAAAHGHAPLGAEPSATASEAAGRVPDLQLSEQFASAPSLGDGGSSAGPAGPGAPRPVRVRMLPRPDGTVEVVAAGSFHPWAHSPDLAMGRLTVRVDLAVLESRLETDARDGGVYLTAHSNLPADDRRCVRAVTLSNRSATALTFAADCKQPFDLGEPEPSVPGCFVDPAGFPVPVRRGRRVVSLPPGESAEVPVLFREPEDREGAVADYSAAGEMLITFANGDQQSVPLHARVVHPEVTVAPAAVDFGEVHVKAPRPARLVLTNDTDADAEWVATERGGRPAFRRGGGGAVQVGDFVVEPGSGVIPGRGLLMPRTQAVTVTFAPRAAGPVRREIVFAVRRGRSFTLAAEGVGTHDETQEFQLALKTM